MYVNPLLFSLKLEDYCDAFIEIGSLTNSSFDFVECECHGFWFTTLRRWEMSLCVFALSFSICGLTCFLSSMEIPLDDKVRLEKSIASSDDLD